MERIVAKSNCAVRMCLFDLPPVHFTTWKPNFSSCGELLYPRSIEPRYCNMID